MKSQNCIKLDKLFNGKVTPNWQKALDVGESEFYGTSLLNYYLDMGILVINSCSINNQRFPHKMLRRLHELIITHDKVIIASSVKEIANHMLTKYNFVYDEQNQIYKKGF